MPDEDIKEKREKLKKKLLDAFNAAAPREKIMNTQELIKNIDKEDDKYYGFFQKVNKWVAESKMSSSLKDPPAADGVYTGTENGHPATYVSSTFLKNQIFATINSGKADKHLDDLEKMGSAAADALKTTADQSAKIKSGLITPKKP